MRWFSLVEFLCVASSLGVSASAKAGVVYSGVLNSGSGFTIGATNNYVYLDFDSMAASHSASLSHIDYFFYGDGHDPINAVSGGGHGGGNTFDYGGLWASTKAYSSGEIVDDAEANWFIGPGFLSWEWSDDVPGYVGIKKSDHAGSYDFGWIEVLYINKSLGEAKVLSFAYEDSGNPILAGDTGVAPVPVPSALLLSWFGIAAGWLLRRNRERPA